MPDITARYEFRAFAQQFGLVEDRIRRGAPCERIRESSEYYLLSSATDETNAKIRDNKMDIKVLLGATDGLEQWTPRVKGELPLPTDMIREQVFLGLGVEIPRLVRPVYTLPQLLEELVRPHPDVRVAHVFKRRFGFMVQGCITEIAELLINGAAIRTVAVESEQPQDVRAALDMLGLGAYENVNYVRALKRILGMEPLPVISGPT